MKIGFIFAFLCASQVCFALASPEKLRIVFLSPNSPNNSYWPQVFRIMEDVAKDLNFDFVPYSLGADDRISFQDDGVKILRSLPKPDAIITTVVMGNARRILDEAEVQHIPVLIHGPLFPQELLSLGQEPRLKYKYWIGYFNQDEELKGYNLGRILIENAIKNRRFAKDGKIHVVGIGGNKSWFGSELRLNGLERAVRENPSATLLQSVPTFWTPEEGRRMTTQLLKRHAETSVVWCASDQLAAGAAEALTAMGRVMGETAFVGGLDLSDNALHRILEKKLVATSAASMLAYAQWTVYLFDYLKGIDFAVEQGTRLEAEIYLASGSNAAQHLALSTNFEKIDFRKFSKFYNKKLKHYDFSLKTLLKEAGVVERH